MLDRQHDWSQRGEVDGAPDNRLAPLTVYEREHSRVCFAVPILTGYDGVGNPLGIHDADHTSESLNFSYNELDQLIAMSGSVGESYGSYIQGSYDIGNLSLNEYERWKQGH